MKKLKVLGTGCPKCRALGEVAKQAAEEMGMEYELEKVTEVMRFADFGVMMTPALVVDGEVKVAGRVPSLPEVKALLAGSV